MQIFGPKVSLDRFRRDALHRQTMCEALAEDEAAYAPIAAAALASVTAIDAKRSDVQRALDLLTRGRALERARKLGAKATYEHARRDLVADAPSIYRALLPHAPSTFDKVGTKRAIAMLQPSVANLLGANAPEGVRAEHGPALQANLTRLIEADRVEDEAEAALVVVRASVLVFKATRQAEREQQYGQLVIIAGTRTAAEEFFLSAYSRGGDDADDDDDSEDPPPAG